MFQKSLGNELQAHKHITVELNVVWSTNESVGLCERCDTYTYLNCLLYNLPCKQHSILIDTWNSEKHEFWVCRRHYLRKSTHTSHLLWNKRPSLHVDMNGLFCIYARLYHSQEGYYLIACNHVLQKCDRLSLWI